MTYRCNHSCLFCSCPWFAPDGRFDVRPELDPHEWMDLITQLASMGVTHFSFSGGEALLKDGLFDIIAHAAQQHSRAIEVSDGLLHNTVKWPGLSLLSNGRLVDRSVVDFCRAHSIQLSLSLPGLRTFGSLTGGDPDLVIEAFRLARRAGVFTVLGIAVTKVNLPELYDTISQGLLAGADTVLLNRFLPGGRGLMHQDKLQLSSPEVLAMLDTAEEVLAAADRRGSLGTEIALCQLPQDRTYRHITVGSTCAAAKSFFVVDPSGYIRVCNHSPVRLVHCRDIDTLPQDPYWQGFVFRRYLPAACSGCDVGHKCDAGCREAAHISCGVVDAVEPGYDVRPFTTSSQPT
ncbi:MAG: radical SAM protein [Candidatus Edwardsbacteria bacterium]|nr:radical SAM protein [Candidatus Edwardsbacteria bacterium]